MTKRNNIFKVLTLILLLLSFSAQSLYSLTLKPGSFSKKDYNQKHFNKTPQQEEISEKSFIENESENDNELDFEHVSFIVPKFCLCDSHELSKSAFPICRETTSSPGKNILISIHNFRI